MFLDPDYGNLSYEWEGKLQAVTKGVHAFLLKSKGRSELYINGKKLIENPGFIKQPVSAQNVMELAPGFHDIRVRYSQAGMFAALELRWAEPGGFDELVPIDALSY